MSWQVIATTIVAAIVAMSMLGPWPFVALCVPLAFLAAFTSTQGGKLRASFSFWGMRAELEGEKPISRTTIEPGTHPKVLRHATGDVDGADQAALNRRRRSEFISTEPLDSDMAALASTGDSVQPVHGASTPAAIGMPRTL